MNSKYTKRIVYWGIIPVFLLLFWLLMSLFFASDYSLSVFVSGYDSSNVTNFKTQELLKNQKIIGHFKAKESNLGIVAVRFYNYQRISDDSVSFRIKEQNSTKWFYENKYKVDQFQPNELFTFGFPIISDSKGKSYDFEIQSLNGKPGNAIGLSDLRPTFVTEFQFTKAELFSKKLQIPSFIIKKIYYSFSDINFAVSSSIYLLPFILYIIWLTLRKNLLKSKNYILVGTFLLGVLVFVFFMQQINRTVEFTLIIIWVFLAIFYRLESSVSFLLALLFLLFAPILILFNLNLIAENASIWTYFFLCIGTFQVGLEIWKKPKELVSYDEFLKSVFSKKFGNYYLNLKKAFLK